MNRHQHFSKTSSTARFSSLDHALAPKCQRHPRCRPVLASGDDVNDAWGKIIVGAGADSAVNGGYGMRSVPSRIEGVLMNVITNVGEGAVPCIGPDPGPGLGPEKNNVMQRGRPVSAELQHRGKSGWGIGNGDLTRRKSAPLRVLRGMRDSYATSLLDGKPIKKLGAAR